MRIQMQELVDLEMLHYQTYLLYSRYNNALGFNKLSKIFKEESLEEIGHIESIMDRMFFLNWYPGFSIPDIKIKLDEDISKPLVQFKRLLEIESVYLGKVKAVIHKCHIIDDYVTEEILEKIIVAVENQIDWLEKQVLLINSLGEKIYLSTMI